MADDPYAGAREMYAVPNSAFGFLVPKEMMSKNESLVERIASSPSGITPSFCFVNSIRAMIHSPELNGKDVLYCEGRAVRADGRTPDHAWLIVDGQIVDLADSYGTKTDMSYFVVGCFTRDEVRRKLQQIRSDRSPGGEVFTGIVDRQSLQAEELRRALNGQESAQLWLHTYPGGAHQRRTTWENLRRILCPFSNGLQEVL